MAAHSEEAIKAIEKEIIQSTIGKSSSPLPLFDLVDREPDFVIKLIRERTRIKSIEKEVQQSEQLVLQAFSNLLARSRAYIFELTAEVRLEKIAKEDISEIERLQLFSYFLTDFILYYPYAEDFAQKNSAQIVMSTASGEISRRFPLEFAGVHSSLTHFQKAIRQKIVTLEKQVQEQSLEEEWKKIPQEKQQKILTEEREKILRDRMLIEELTNMPPEIRKKMLEEEGEKMWAKEGKNMPQKEQQTILKKELEENLRNRILTKERGRMSKAKWAKMSEEQLRQILRDKIPEKRREQMLQEEWNKIPEKQRENMLKEKWKQSLEGELKNRLKIARKKMFEEAWKNMSEEERAKISTEAWVKIPEEEREELLKEERNGRLEEERTRRLEEELSGPLEEDRSEILRAEISLRAFNELLPIFQTCLLTQNLNSSEKPPLEIQLIAVKTIVNELAEKTAEKEAALKALEKEEAEVLSEAEVLAIEAEVLAMDEKQLLDIFYTHYRNNGLSEKEANIKARIAVGGFEKKRTVNEKVELENENIGSSSSASPAPPAAPPPPAPPLPSITSRQAALVKAALRSQASISQPKGQAVDLGDLMKSIGEKKLKAGSEVAKLPPAMKYTPINSRDKDLNEYEFLHVLSALPEGKEIDRLDNGYILIGSEKPGSARLYYLHKDKKDKLVECRLDKRDGLIPLCDHVKSLEQGVTRLTLDCKQQRDLIITPCGGHNHKLAEDAVSAPVLAKSSSLQSGPSARFSFHAPQKESLFNKYGIVLLKDGQDWPEEATMANETLYFKWDKSKNVLAAKYRKEDGSIFDHERKIEFARNIQLVSNAFEQSEATELALEARQYLQIFVQRPNPRMSVMLPKEALKQSSILKSDESAVSPGKEKEEVKVKVEVIVEKEEEKGEKVEQANDSLNKNKKEKLSPSSSRFYTTFPPSLIEETKAKSPTEESNVDSSAEGTNPGAQLNSGGNSPGMM